MPNWETTTSLIAMWSLSVSVFFPSWFVTVPTCSKYSSLLVFLIRIFQCEHRSYSIHDCLWSQCSSKVSPAVESYMIFFLIPFFVIHLIEKNQLAVSLQQHKGVKWTGSRQSGPSPARHGSDSQEITNCLALAVVLLLALCHNIWASFFGDSAVIIKDYAYMAPLLVASIVY